MLQTKKPQKTQHQQKTSKQKQPNQKTNKTTRPKQSSAPSNKNNYSPKEQQVGKRPSYTYRTATGTLKIPEALPTKKYKESAFSRIFRKKPTIQEIVREPTSGGIVFRMSKDQKDIEILLIQDSKNRWTIPKGHIEPGETAKQTAIREIGEESGLHHIRVLTWLGKIHFKYRRQDKLVLMTTQIYLMRALDESERPQKEKWMNGIKWFRFADALDAIEYEDIEKLMLIAKKKIRSGEFN
ncbi:NUDIX domain-containing protein [Candidatus Saccharibacteria bacterium]|nr:NUDIX domain-containing protein [Candidatus Saccharibacteria bacterium]